MTYFLIISYFFTIYILFLLNLFHALGRAAGHRISLYYAPMTPIFKFYKDANALTLSTATINGLGQSR